MKSSLNRIPLSPPCEGIFFM